MESTFGIVFKGYPYFKEKFEKENKDIIKTRLLFKKTLVLRGVEAAEIFYDQSKFQRKGATPKRFQKTLFGEGGVQGTDGEAHRKRKHMFMQFMGKEAVDRIKENFLQLWQNQLPEWMDAEELVLFDQVEKILCMAACNWAGVPLKEGEEKLRSKQLSRIIRSAGAVGVDHYRGRIARKKAEKWIIGFVKEIRSKKQVPGENSSILETFSLFRDEKGKLLPEKIVAVEVLNILRPIVAIARYITFSALALHEHPQYKKRLKADEGLDLLFVHEVRRYYPFFPFVAAQVKEDFEWKDEKFPKGTRVLLDIYATNHDKRTWVNPAAFYAERFKDWEGSAYNFIPQGGGDHHQNHRCAGEWITIQITCAAVNFLVKEIDYDVPEQDLKISMNRIPATPKSRFKIFNVRRSKR
ncbi:cytochrome P450 [Autumnicola edwardsiae]|uniref:Cytochrome P450 n=1 Tax=Autumnicola edwardsiae TaxID=3075594 RepID=A0ABU3CXF4_9FLAO|nr:cytochrome P450 [Zunongwangia sp. F297]MDT0651049.1 cytochrome P450 [Zunongwangia sp. F297]